MPIRIASANAKLVAALKVADTPASDSKPWARIGEIE
jgi:hypothetical protein